MPTVGPAAVRVAPGRPTATKTNNGAANTPTGTKAGSSNQRTHEAGETPAFSLN